MTRVGLFNDWMLIPGLRVVWFPWVVLWLARLTVHWMWAVSFLLSLVTFARVVGVYCLWLVAWLVVGGLLFSGCCLLLLLHLKVIKNL